MTKLILFSNNKTFRVDIPDMQPVDLPETGALCAGYVIKPPVEPILPWIRVVPSKAVPPGSAFLLSRDDDGFIDVHNGIAIKDVT